MSATDLIWCVLMDNEGTIYGKEVLRQSDYEQRALDWRNRDSGFRLVQVSEAEYGRATPISFA